MASKIDITAKLGLDGSGFEKTLDKAGHSISHFGNEQLGGLKRMIVEAFTIGAVVEFGKSIIELGSKINDTAIRLGLTTDEVQELGYAASQNGTDIDAMARGIEHIAKAQESIKDGSGESMKLVAIFDKMGISFRDIVTQDPKEIFYKLAESLEKANVAGEVQAGLIQLMGKNAGPLIVAMKELGDKSKELHGMGGIISPEDIKTLDDAGDKLDRFKLLAKVYGARFIAGGSRETLSFGDRLSVAATDMNNGNSNDKSFTDDIAATDAFTEIMKKKLAKKTAERLKAKNDPQALEDAMSNNMPKANVGKVGTDSLLNVGNFLGSSGRQTIETPVKSIDLNVRRLVDLMMQQVNQSRGNGGSVP